MATSRAHVAVAVVASLALVTLAASPRTEAHSGVRQDSTVEITGEGGWTKLAPSQSYVTQDKDYVIIMNSNHETLTFVDKSAPHEIQRVSLRR